MRAAIIGLGVVGRAQARLFASLDPVTYDPATHDTYPADQIAACDFAVISVGTPPARGGAADMDGFRQALLRLPGDMPVLIRSTVPPGTTALVAAARPGPVAFCPEFMHEREGGAWRESADVPWLILGGAPEAIRFFRPVLWQVHPAGIYACPPTVAELSKYCANIYWAARVTFVNELAGVCAALGADWDEVRAAWLQDERVDPAYTAMAGFPPGFGGRCLPKDLAALAVAAEDAGYKPDFLRAIEDANVRFTNARFTA